MTVERLEAARRAYYNGAAPIMSDAAFDALEAELRRADPGNEYFRHHGAPYVAIGTKVRHNVPMGSLNNVDDVAAMRKWYGAVNPTSVFFSDKLDGASLSLYWKGGVLIQAATRGRDGIGEDITRNVRLMKGIPARLKTTFTGHVRGEVIVLKSDFAAHFPGESNPRATANGTMKRKSDPGPCKHLSVYCYQMVPDVGSYTSKEAEFEALKQAGLLVPRSWSAKSVDGIAAIYQDNIAGSRAALDYQIDGLVLCVSGTDEREAHGEESGNPRGAVAFKFPRDGATTALRDIVWQVGGSGRVTPVAIFDPVQLVGTEVERATLHNCGQISRIVREAGAPRDHFVVGDRICVEKAGDVIPAVEALIAPASGLVKDLFAPVNCPACEGLLRMDGEYLICPNASGCPAQTVGRVLNWTSKVNILGWGDELVSALCTSGNVTAPSDLYKLSLEALANTEMAGKKLGMARAMTCRANLHAKKSLGLALVVGSLGIQLCGRTTLDAIVGAGHDTIDKLAALRVSDLVEIPGIGREKADAFVAGFAELRGEIDALLAAGVEIAAPRMGSLRGKVVCFTGFRDQPLRDAIESAGGTYKDSYSKAVTHLVCKDPSKDSAKLQAARKNGTKIVSIEEARGMTKA